MVSWFVNRLFWHSKNHTYRVKQTRPGNSQLLKEWSIPKIIVWRSQRLPSHSNSKGAKIRPVKRIRSKPNLIRCLWDRLNKAEVNYISSIIRNLVHPIMCYSIPTSSTLVFNTSWTFSAQWWIVFWPKRFRVSLIVLLQNWRKWAIGLGLLLNLPRTLASKG